MVAHYHVGSQKWLGEPEVIEDEVRKEISHFDSNNVNPARDISVDVLS